MTLHDLYKVLQKMNLPLCYQEFPKTQNPPYIAYFEDEADSITADGVVVLTVRHIEIHMITTKRDTAKESELESLLTDVGLTWERIHDYDSTQKIHDAAYELELIE